MSYRSLGTASTFPTVSSGSGVGFVGIGFGQSAMMTRIKGSDNQEGPVRASKGTASSCLSHKVIAGVVE